jgi:hypothetical protein
MRKNLKKGALILTLVLAFLACDKENNLDVANQSSSFLQKKFFVSKSEALALVETLQRNRRATETSGKEVGDIVTFADRAGAAIFYVINFKDNKGHLLLSADKRMKPVLAFSDTGIFDLETDIQEFSCGRILSPNMQQAFGVKPKPASMSSMNGGSLKSVRGQVLRQRISRSGHQRQAVSIS